MPTKVGALIFNLNILNNTLGKIYLKKKLGIYFRIRGTEFKIEI